MNYIITAVAALLVSFISTPIVKKIALKLGAVDIPVDSRRMHKNPIALLGGFAIIVGFTVAILYNIIMGSVRINRTLTGMFFGILIIIVCGFLDDKYSLKPRYKFLFQLAAAIVFVLISDSQIDYLTNPFSADGGLINFSPILSWPLTIIWIVGITNAINFIDGLDGLAAGVSSISAISLFFISISGAVFMESSLTPYLTAAIAGAAIGFLPFNFNPAKIFMGETGAAFLGFVLATISVDGLLKSYAAMSLAIPFLIIGLPIFDVAFAVIRRLANGVSPARSDRSHLHHKLIDLGLTQKQSVIILYIASAVLGLCGFIFANKNIMSAVILLILLPVILFACIKYFSSERSKENNVKAAKLKGALGNASDPNNP